MSGSYALRASLTVGSSLFFASGTPLNEFAEDPYPGDRTNVRDRGTAGRTPSIWSADLRIAYELRISASRWRPRLLLDVYNLGNQRRAVDFDQLHYTTPDHTGTNPNYLKVNQYQAPLTARLGLVVGF